MKNIIKLSVVAVILALGMILSSVMLSKLFIKIKHEKSIVVKGYAERNVIADIGKLYCSYTTRKPTLKEAFEELQQNKNRVLSFLAESGFKGDEIGLYNVNTSKIYKKDAEGHRTNEIEYFKASQAIMVTSGDVRLIKDMSKRVSELIKDGIDVYAQAPAYYVSALGEVKVELIAAATEDGYKRALTMAENSGGRVGALSSARQGVFQITVPNSTQTSGYGIYDTSTIEKTVKAVVTLEYAID